MSESEPYSLVLASDYRVDDPEQMWSLIEKRRSHLESVGAHHVVLYVSLWELGRVLVTIGIRHRRSIAELLRSPAIFEWFDIAGVDDIPAIFAGEVLEKINLQSSSLGEIGGVVVGAVAAVDDVSELLTKVHGALDRFRQRGVRKVWLYQAFDDGQEMMLLQEVDNENTARRCIDDPDAAAAWMSGIGFGAYPSLFVGRLAHVMTIEAVP